MLHKHIPSLYILYLSTFKLTLTIPNVFRSVLGELCGDNLSLNMMSIRSATFSSYFSNIQLSIRYLREYFAAVILETRSLSSSSVKRAGQAP